LINNSFDSPQYHSLTSNKLAIEIIKNYSQPVSIFDEQLFAPESILRTLFKTNIFLVKDQWQEFLNHPHLVSDCVHLLRAYTDWWLLGQGLSDDFKKRDEVFQKAYPYIFFAFTYLAHYQPQQSVIAQLLKTPQSPTLFGLVDLWLQRKVALEVYDTAGLAAFLPYLEAARPALIYYLIIKNKLNEREKVTLREIVLQSGIFTSDDPLRHHHMPFYMYIESLIMERL
jgi:hypothetical protein